MTDAERSSVGKPAGAAVPATVVAVCDGHRCRALHSLGAPEDDSDQKRIPRSDPFQPLREAVRTSSDGVLVIGDCLGTCARGSAAMVGHARVNAAGRLTWTRRPVLVGRLDIRSRMRMLTDWLAQPGHAVGALPPELIEDDEITET